MTSTYEGYYAFTDPTRLGAKQPDHLTTCNAVESEKKNAVCSKVNQPSRKRPETLQERDSRAKKHSTQLLCRRTGAFISHCSWTRKIRRSKVN